ncbi:MAG: hypothetical protein WCH21_11570 [Bacteroidota bacterium]
MKIKRNSLILAVVFPFVFLAQGPGYIGKKSVVGYGCEVNPAISGATNILPFNLTQQLYFEYAVKTRMSLGIAIKYAATKYDNKETVSNLGNPTDEYTINAFSFVPCVKLYSKQFVAPWGKYWTLGAALNATGTKHDPYMYLTKSLSDHDTLLMDFGPEKQMHTSVDLLIGKGKSRIIKDKFVIDYGFNFQLIALINGITGSNMILTQDNYIKETAVDRVRGLNRFNVYLKIGYLF